MLDKEVEVLQRSEETGPGADDSGSKRDGPVFVMESIPLHSPKAVVSICKHL